MSVVVINIRPFFLCVVLRNDPEEPHMQGMHSAAKLHSALGNIWGGFPSGLVLLANVRFKGFKA